jgi:uncharacterized protein YacL
MVSQVSTSKEEFLPWGLALSLSGLPIGAIVMPYITTVPLGKGIDRFNQVPAATLMSGTIGLFIGLVFASLLSVPLYSLEGWHGWGVPLMLSFGLGSMGLLLGIQREADVGQAFLGMEARPKEVEGAEPARILVDTSAVIDGRIADLTQTGFVEGTLVVPRFVLDELRHIADSSDPMRRTRGRRGLEVLTKLREDDSVAVEVLDQDLSNGTEVDAMLVKIACSMGATILTTDFNLNRVAELQGIRVLNVNELANALKPIVLPGEELHVSIIQEGKEAGQGVAYLDDGTMVVVEGGKRFINTNRDVTVTRVLQTGAGRMIFAQNRQN